MNHILPPLERKYIAKNLEFLWENIAPYFEELISRKIKNTVELIQWLKDKSELDAALEEEFAWRYIRMNIDTRDQELAKKFHYFVQEINPKIAPFEDQLNKKLSSSEYKKDLNQSEFKILLRTVENQIKLYREENIPLLTKLEEDSQKYGAISAEMSINYNEKEYTIQQASKFLKETDRTIRERVFDLISKRRLQDKDSLNELFNQLIQLRTQVAINAGFDNYRDYKFEAMARFDYSPEDCFEFHESIKKYVVPLAEEVQLKRKELLQLDKLKPWDNAVDIEGKAPLKPFETGEELLSKTIACFSKLDPFFANCLIQMQEKKHLDLESKKGKAPGGFNYPLYESGYPFIYMNAVGSFRDITTMVHEGGHAIHSVLSHPLELVEFKNLTSEIAELASMSMELISMDHWDVFFDNEEDITRAKRDQLLDILSTLPWVACIDKFQHWIYTKPSHTVADRENYWLSLLNEFGSNTVDWTGYEDDRKNMWQKQLHLYEVPFYYIEYGMAQLGAIAIWKNFRENPEKTIQQYKDALSLGYTKSIGEIYETAGISFDFSSEYVKELASFIHQEINKTFK
ncbi:MAG: M3 family oligoendopeptidase [Bacteroidetes bacterium]|nr:MAG: M3 family oligoendopeptidase [Bacteroidota bacterium]MBL1145578.1 M3 family oligoendopeptidase [Bacteroidota bacterium]NOG58374.1 M3 family oligoendopeptidase [Bacteroidota bacterium]